MEQKSEDEVRLNLG